MSIIICIRNLLLQRNYLTSHWDSIQDFIADRNLERGVLLTTAFFRIKRRKPPTSSHIKSWETLFGLSENDVMQSPLFKRLDLTYTHGRGIFLLLDTLREQGLGKMRIPSRKERP
jgi:hypothetical protein